MKNDFRMSLCLASALFVVAGAVGCSADSNALHTGTGGTKGTGGATTDGGSGGAKSQTSVGGAGGNKGSTVPGTAGASGTGGARTPGAGGSTGFNFPDGGFNIPGDTVLAYTCRAFGFVLPVFVAAYLCLKNREVAQQ